jgi:FtsH-binding integral membrane protein
LNAFEGKLKKRDSLEIIVALVMIPIAIVLAYFANSFLQQLGFGLIVPYCLLVIFQLKRVKKFKTRINPIQSQNAFLSQSKDYLVKEMNLLKSVLYWYLLPALICATLINLGSDSSQLEQIITFVVMVIVFAYIYYLNRKAVKNDFEPLIDKITTALNN